MSSCEPCTKSARSRCWTAPLSAGIPLITCESASPRKKRRSMQPASAFASSARSTFRTRARNVTVPEGSAPGATHLALQSKNNDRGEIPLESPAMTDKNLMTVAEQSGFRTTGRTDEVERLCAAFAAKWPDTVRCIEFGRSAEGRPMLALLASRADPRKEPLLMLQGGIQPGESDGKDAVFMTLLFFLIGTVAPSSLDHFAFLFVPAFYVEGHERKHHKKRPIQN